MWSHFTVCYTVEDSFIGSVACIKKWGAHKLESLRFKKLGEGGRVWQRYKSLRL